MSQGPAGSLTQRLAGFATVDIPHGPGRYRLVGRLLKALALLFVLFFALLALAVTLAVLAIAFLALVGWLLLDAATPLQALAAPPWGTGAAAGAAALVGGLFVVGTLTALAANHAVIWWARRERRGVWAARAVGGLAVLASAGSVGGWLRMGEGIGMFSLALLALFCTGAAVVVLSFDTFTLHAFDRDLDELRFEPVEEPTRGKRG